MRYGPRASSVGLPPCLTFSQKATRVMTDTGWRRVSGWETSQRSLSRALLTAIWTVPHKLLGDGAGLRALRYPADETRLRAASRAFAGRPRCSGREPRRNAGSSGGLKPSAAATGAENTAFLM